MTDRISILGIPIDSIHQSEALALLQSNVKSDGFAHVITPNNEMLLTAASNKKFHDLLQRSTLNLADSTGLVLASKYLGTPLPCRNTGVDTVSKFCGELDESSPVFLLGAAEGVAEKAATELRIKNSQLKISGCYAGDPSSASAPSIMKMINDSGAKILLVAYGAPKQDIWIDTYKDQLPHIRIAIGVGGTFDFLAGTIKRAPKLFRSLGLEWLWRLALQPSRAERIFKAVVVFPLLVLRYGKRSPFGILE